MTEQERELKHWITVNVMGWIVWREEEYPYRDGYSKGDEHGEKCLEYDMPDWPTDRAASQEVLERCCEMTCPEIQRQRDEPAWTITARTFGSACNAKAETLPLAICKFAQKLFATV